MITNWIWFWINFCLMFVQKLRRMLRRVVQHIDDDWNSYVSLYSVPEFRLCQSLINIPMKERLVENYCDGLYIITDAEDNFFYLQPHHKRGQNPTRVGTHSMWTSFQRLRHQFSSWFQCLQGCFRLLPIQPWWISSLNAVCTFVLASSKMVLYHSTWVPKDSMYSLYHPQLE